jgi:hypothetical protein
MSWLNKYTQNLIIITGDGKQYEVFTMPNFSKEIEFNATEFSFVEIDGQLIKKRKQTARKFPIEFYFIGENHIEESNAFEISARNTAPWVINHPYYDGLLIQMLSIKFDDTDLNVTKITGVAVETIPEPGNVNRNNIDALVDEKTTLDEIIADDPVFEITVKDVDSFKNVAAENYKLGLKILTIPDEAEQYFNAYNTALSLVGTLLDTATAPLSLTMQSITTFLSMPAYFTASVSDRIRILTDQFNNLRNTINGLITVPSKKLYELQAATIVSSMGTAAITPGANDYENATQTFLITEKLITQHNVYLNDIDTLQGLNGGNPAFFVPGFNLNNQLNNLMDQSIAGLYQIAFAGKKEFLYVLPDDSNIILLTYKFYKLDSNDNNINEFVKNNNFTHSQIALGIKKGTTVIYYK